MGSGIGFRCGKCGYDITVYLGIGFAFPRVYQEVVTAVRKGKFGREWKELFERTSGAAVDANRELYVCSACGRFREDMNLCLYEPKDADVTVVRDEAHSGFMPSEVTEYVTPAELKNRYRLVKVYPHLCRCGKRMHQYREGDRLKYPKCKDGWMEYDPSGWINWD